MLVARRRCLAAPMPVRGADRRSSSCLGATLPARKRLQCHNGTGGLPQNARDMDLTNAAPRSAKDKLAGIVSLKRTIDKAKAHNEGHLGEYDYDCPHDKPLFEFVGTNGDEFARKVKELGTDEAIAAWLTAKSLSHKSKAEIDAFNNDRMHWHPEAGSHSAEYFDNLRQKIAPDRPEIVTWFDLLDIDEGRPVPNPTAV